LPSNLCLVSSNFATKNLYEFILHALIISSSLTDDWNNIRWVQIIKLLILQFLSASSDPNIILSTPFSNTFSLCSYLDVTDQVPHPYKKKIWQNYSSVYFNPMFLDSIQEYRRFWTKQWQDPLQF
jgi:hypothetical protein